MPGNDATMKRGLIKDLVVPETDGAFEELSGGHQEGGIPKQVVETWSNSPCSQRMKERLCWISGFVGMVLVKEMPVRMRWFQ